MKQQPRSDGRLLRWTKIDGRMNSQKRTLEVTKLDDQDLFGKTTFRMKIINLNSIFLAPRLRSLQSNCPILDLIIQWFRLVQVVVHFYVH
jgi:hypothetical protein